MFLDSYLKLHTFLMLHDQISIDDYIDAKIIKNTGFKSVICLFLGY